MSSPPSLTKGSLVWAKLPAFPWWPAKVTDVTGSDVHVTFCGTGDLGTASRADVVPYGSRLSLRETKQKERWKKKFKHAVGEADQRPADGGDVEEGAEHDDAGRHRSDIVRSRMRQPVCAAKHSGHSPPAHPREDEEKTRPHIGSWTSRSPCSSVTSCTGPSLSICGKISPGSTVRPSPGE